MAAKCTYCILWLEEALHESVWAVIQGMQCLGCDCLRLSAADTGLLNVREVCDVHTVHPLVCVFCGMVAHSTSSFCHLNVPRGCCCWFISYISNSCFLWFSLCVAVASPRL